MSITRNEIKDFLEKIDSKLEGDQSLCVIGSTATILLGQPSRQTEDIDVWARASRFQEKLLRSAVEAAGLVFDPKTEDIDLPYVQIVHPGIVQVPGYDPATNLWLGQEADVIWSGRHLTVSCPPAEAIIASKMRRFEDRDIQDAIWLMTSKAIDAEAVMSAIRKLPTSHRELAEENFSILGYLGR